MLPPAGLKSIRVGNITKDEFESSEWDDCSSVSNVPFNQTHAIEFSKTNTIDGRVDDDGMECQATRRPLGSVVETARHGSPKFTSQTVVDQLDQLVTLEDVRRHVGHAARVRCRGPQGVRIQVVEDDAVVVRMGHVQQFVKLKQVSRTTSSSQSSYTNQGAA